MPSLVPGFEYDIFISYRHKDNKYDGWVSEFVANLKKELEATFKEEVSVYFDLNPRDGLLEIHHVDKSLEDKLKTVILIPVLSQTYCDPKSFAWKHELCAFNKLASLDSFGRDIRLPNGNVTSRILPVRVHDIDGEDQQLFEKEIDGSLRSIDFIFRSPGVNRPLKPEDQRTDNSSRILYRDQINKVANATKEIVMAMQKKTPSRPLVKPEMALSGSKKKTLALSVLAIVVLTVLGYFVSGSFVSAGEGDVDKSIVVLPFVDMSQEHDQEYFTDGIMEEILNHLAKISELRVISRTSSMKYKGTKLSVSEIAKELKVTNILEGSVRRSGDRIRITVQLIDVVNDKHIWSEDYDYRELKDIFSIQSEVSRRVAVILKGKLTDSQKQSLAKSNTDNPEAYRLYLKGRFFWAQRTNESYDSAEGYYKKAIQLDPGYALAYSGLADCYTLGKQGLTMADEAPIAKAYLTKALSIDSTLCEALTTLGFLQSHVDYDWEQGKKTLEKALRINSNYPIAHLYYGNIFIFRGDIEQGLSEVRRALELDPVSSSVNWALGSRYFGCNKPDLAIKQLQKTLTIDPSNIPAKITMALSFLQKGMNKEALDILTKLPEKMQQRNILVALAHAKDKNMAQARIEAEKIRLEGVRPNELTNNVWLAHLEISLENYEAALTQLERAYELRSLNIIGIKIESGYDPIRNQARFMALLKKMNLD